MDDRPQVTAGFKFNDWELRGVPMRVEVGPRDVQAGTAVVVRRLGQGKQAVPLAVLPVAIPEILNDFQAFLLARATAFRDERTHQVDSWEDFTRAVSAGWALALRCGQPACEAAVKAETSASPRCLPLAGTADSGQCVRCGARSGYRGRVIFGRAY